MKQDTQQQKLKDEKIRQMQISGAEAVIQSFLEQGLKIESAFEEERVEMRLTLHSGKTVRLHTSYASLTECAANVLDLIQKVRLENVCRLLKKTDLSIAEVTMRSGYELTSNLGRLFRRTYGMSMRDYRAKHGPNA